MPESLDNIFDHPIISQRYFFPRATGPIVNAVDVNVHGAQLRCASFEHDPAWPWVVYFHGNGETVADSIPSQVEWFRGLGANVFLATYRGYGGSTGVPLLAGMLDDVRAISDACPAPAQRQIPFGRSVGSIYAIELASVRPVAGLIIESGISDVLQRIMLRATPRELGTTLEHLKHTYAQTFDHRAKLGALEAPSLFLHARGDTLVGSEHAVHNHQWSGSEDKRLVLFDRGDHNTIFAANAMAYTEAVRDFVSTL